MTPDSASLTEDRRAMALLEAQGKADALFAEIAATLIRPGITETELSEAIRQLAQRRHGVRRHWHKRVVRSGPNTLRPYAAEPPDRVIAEDDILFVDLGPVFAQWEADFGRTFVLGADPAKLRLRDDLARVFGRTKAHFQERPGLTGAQLYAAACRFAGEAGWEFGGEIAGHLVGEFPHERIADDKVTLYIRPGNDRPLESLDQAGRRRHWILEIHLVDRARAIGGFCEELLTLG